MEFLKILTTSTPQRHKKNHRKGITAKSKSIAVKDHNDNFNWREIPATISSESLGTTTTTATSDDANSTLKKPFKPLPLRYSINNNSRRQSSFYIKTRYSKYLSNARDNRRKKSKQQRFDHFNEARCSIFRKQLKKSKFNSEIEINQIILRQKDENSIVIEESVNPVSHSSFENVSSEDELNACAMFERIAKSKISQAPFLDEKPSSSRMRKSSLIAKKYKFYNQKSRNSLHPGSVIMNRKIPQLCIESGLTKNISVDKSFSSSNITNISSCLKLNNFWLELRSFLTISHLNICFILLILIILICVVYKNFL